MSAAPMQLLRYTTLQILLFATLVALVLGLFTAASRAGKIRTIQHIAFSPGGTYFAAGYFDGTVRVWRVDSDRPRLTADVPGNEVDWLGEFPVLQFEDDRRLIIFESLRRRAARSSMMVRELDLTKGKLSAVMPINRLGKLTRSIPTDPRVVMPKISADGNRRAERDEGGTLHLSDTATRKPLWHFAGERDEPLALSGDGSLVATIGLGPSQSPNVVILDGQSGALLEYVPLSDAVSVNWMEFSRDGSLLAVGGSRGVEVYDTKLKMLVQKFPMRGLGASYHRRSSSYFWSQYLALAPDGKSLVSSDGDGIYFWDLETGKRTHRIGGTSRLIPAALFVLGFAAWAAVWGMTQNRFVSLPGWTAPLGLKLCWGVMIVGGLVALAIPIGLMFLVGPWIFPTIYFSLLVGVLAIARGAARDTYRLRPTAALQLANLLAVDPANPVFAAMEFALLRSAKVRNYLQSVNLSQI